MSDEFSHAARVLAQTSMNKLQLRILELETENERIKKRLRNLLNIEMLRDSNECTQAGVIKEELTKLLTKGKK